MATTDTINMAEQRARATLLRPYDRRSKRYWDKHQHQMTVELLPGQRHLARRGELLSTVVGSGCCVCFRHRESGVAGMASILIAAGVEPVLCVEHCLLSLDDLTNRILYASGGKEPAELDVWFVMGGDVGTLDPDEREFQLGVVSSILSGYGSPVVQTQRGQSCPLVVRFDSRTGSLTVTELRQYSMLGMKRDLEWLARARSVDAWRLATERCG